MTSIFNRKCRICLIGIAVSTSALTVNGTTLQYNTPNNAALLYYQAALCRPEPQDYLAISSVLTGGDPNDSLREYLRMRQTQETLYLIKVATNIPECNWGILCSDGYDLGVKAVAQLQHLGRLLEAYARTVGGDGRYRESLEYCLMLRRFASHMGDETSNTYVVSQSFDIRALTCIQHILSSMPPDLDTLIWLRSQLMVVQGTPWLPARALRNFRDNCVQSLLHDDPNWGAAWRDYVGKSIRDEKVKKEMLSLTDNELLARASETYDDFLKSVLTVIDSSKSYDEKRTELQRLDRTLHATEGHPITILIGSIGNPSALVLPYYEQSVQNTAYHNAIMTAIALYLITAQTGQLPHMLPSDVPGDPYSAGGFDYETTPQGFVLRSRLQRFNPKFHQYEFKLRMPHR